MGSVFLSFALGCSHLPKNSILSAKRQFSACFSNCSNSLNFKDKINCNTTKQNDLKWGKTYTGLKFDLVHFNGPQTKFICDSLYKHPVIDNNNMGKPGSSHFRDPPLISEESPLKSEAVLIKYLDFWDF